MPRFTGNINNPSPNEIKSPISRSEKFIGDNRATHVRRDNDNQKSFSISLYDVDETIYNHLESLQLQIEDVGKKVKVPVIYGSPEKWVSAQRDGYLRDYQGKLILPAIIFKRTTSGNDTNIPMFNRYLETSFREKYSIKNKYTQFSILSGQSSPVNEIYNITFPKHMIFTYHFIIWTEKVEQMNELVQIFRYNSNDYWGNVHGYKFRTKIDSFDHTVETQADDDRIVKTEFDLSVNGYILPDTMTKLDRHESTTKKSFTKKKIVMGAEVVSTDFEMETLNKNRNKWANPNYPNLQVDVELPSPAVSVVSDITDNSSLIDTPDSYSI